MIELNIVNGKFMFRNFEYEFVEFEELDGKYFHIITNRNTFCFEYSSTKINGNIYENFNQLNIN